MAVAHVSRLLALGLAAITVVALAPAAPAVTPAADANPGAWTYTTITEANVQAAVAALPGIVADVRERTGIPGIAVAVVYKDAVLLSSGFGERVAGTGVPVDADTRFQMASVSKPVGATAISRAVSEGLVSWDDPIRTTLPEFALDSPYVTRSVTIGDMYAHRSGLPDHAGDDLEDIGFGRSQILDRLRYLPLAPFRSSYFYTNFGITAGGEAVARAAGTSWEEFTRSMLFAPAGMNSSSYRFSDYANATNKALTHMKVDGAWRHGETRNAQPEAPAGGLSSTANDMSRWLRLQLANGAIDGTQLIDADVLQLMRQPHVVSNPSADPSGRSGMYGYGIGSGVDGTGHVRWSHSGAFMLGAATVVDMVPAAGLGIVVMSNAEPHGYVESIATSFLDIAETGSVQRDWLPVYERGFAGFYVDHSVLAGRTPPAGAKPALPLSRYAGTYANDYVGTATVVRRGSGLTLVLGPKRMSFPLTSWGGNRFSYQPTGENALGPSAVDFRPNAGTVTIEHLDENGMGTLTRR